MQVCSLKQGQVHSPLFWQSHVWWRNQGGTHTCSGWMGKSVDGWQGLCRVLGQERKEPSRGGNLLSELTLLSQDP